MNGIIGGFIALLVGGGLATASVVGLVSSSTSVDGTSPTSVNQPEVPYGSTE